MNIQIYGDSVGLIIYERNNEYMIGYHSYDRDFSTEDKSIARGLGIKRYVYREILARHNAIIGVRKTYGDNFFIYQMFEDREDAQAAFQELESIYILNKIVGD